jgi:hypothetical protein
MLTSTPNLNPNPNPRFDAGQPRCVMREEAT